MMAGVSNRIVINSGDLTYFEGFSLLLAGLAVFAITFAAFYIAKWKCRYWFNPAYSVQSQDLKYEYQRVKRENGESSDEDKMDEMLTSYYYANEKQIGKRQSKR